ncbi:hypothetical protein [Erythrobacter sp. SD-21]|uniref:hypothetical protein n=1 Tax=Erythrobacter sp. SD-21 TaxID=161528 RepID=UPI000153F0BF|nr:hypothetical protein [Erythrobacter sp. SD-21]EDL48245.1 hypothetical protein ED21_31879 [Erythrobacter sp. SD-21]
MTFDVDTGRKPSCPFCDLPEEDWEDCPHLVAVFDRTFLDCYGGEIFDRDGEFRDLVEAAFSKRLKGAESVAFEKADLERLWQQSKYEQASQAGEESYWDLNDRIFQELLIERLLAAGARALPGRCEDSTPLASSVYTILFATFPRIVILKALQLLVEETILSE